MQGENLTKTLAEKHLECLSKHPDWKSLDVCVEPSQQSL